MRAGSSLRGPGSQCRLPVGLRPVSTRKNKVLPALRALWPSAFVNYGRMNTFCPTRPLASASGSRVAAARPGRQPADLRAVGGESAARTARSALDIAQVHMLKRSGRAQTGRARSAVPWAGPAGEQPVRASNGRSGGPAA